ncbi:Smr/MutS family protein [Aromatoleum sp.]|uniref:Smr/MutS family protein n=1 Tax=Aromatoleum sp. TaxID=2307007 RepID=UPI0039C8BCCF
MRGQLGLASAHGQSKASRSTRPATPPARDTDLDRQLLRAALGDVKPLADKAHRAVIETPKPAPVPRPHPEAVDDEPLVRPLRRPPPQDGAELFRFEMQDVSPIGHTDRVDIGIDQRPASRHSPWSQSGRRPLGERPVASQLPPDADCAPAEELFQYAVRGVQPIDTRNRAEIDQPAPQPHPIKRAEDEREALRESLEAPLSLEDRLEMGDEASFLRPGLPRRVLTDLRRGRWVLQGQLDLHGFNREEAREELSQFLVGCLQQGHRCVRVIHGKGLGSPGKESILKQLSRGWLAQREEILAFCQAGPHDGGSGALLVLLRAGTRPRS